MPDTQQPLAIRAVRLQQIGRPEMPGEATLQAVCEAEDIGQPLRYSFKLRWNQVVLKEYPFSESNRMKAAIHLAGCYEVECTVRTADGSRQGKASAEPVRSVVHRAHGAGYQLSRHPDAFFGDHRGDGAPGRYSHFSFSHHAKISSYH